MSARHLNTPDLVFGALASTRGSRVRNAAKEASEGAENGVSFGNRKQPASSDEAPPTESPPPESPSAEKSSFVPRTVNPHARHSAAASETTEASSSFFPSSSASLNLKISLATVAIATGVLFALAQNASSAPARALANARLIAHARR